MNNHSYLEVWSPLRWINVRFFVSDEGDWMMKVGSGRRKHFPTFISILTALKQWHLHDYLKYRQR